MVFWHQRRVRKEISNIVDDISKLGDIVNQVSQLFGYDASKVVYTLSNLESLKAEHAKYQAWIEEVKTDYNGINQERSQLQNVVASFNQSLSVYDQLSDMNFGLKHLKLLWNTILEIATANNIPRYSSQRWRKRIDKAKILFSEEMGCRKNKLLA
jgi:hypothetical protein